MKLLEELLELTKKQKEALYKEDVEWFGMLLNDREVCIEKIKKNNRLEQIEQNTEMYQVLREIKLLDDQNVMMFCDQLEQVKSKLKRVRLTQKSSAIYNNPYDISYEEGIFFDKK